MKHLFEQKKRAIMMEIKSIAKSGHNAFFNYNYAPEADVLRVVRDVMVQHRITFSCACNSFAGQPIELVSNKGQKRLLYNINLQCSLVDEETGYSETYDWLGSGADESDKALYKAYSSGIKYFLLKTFLIPTGDDVEGDESGEPDTTKNSPTPRQNTKPAKVETPNTTPQGKTERPAMSTAERGIMNALLTYFKGQENDKFKLNKDKLCDSVWATLSHWPSTPEEAKKIKQDVSVIDVMEQKDDSHI